MTQDQIPCQARPARRRWALLASGLVLVALQAWPDTTAAELPAVWPDPAALTGVDGREVRFASHSPFTLADVGTDADRPTTAQGWLFLPQPATHGTRPVPGVVLLHGSAGVLEARELTYGRQFATMGMAALVIDAFAARRDRARRFIDRLMRITESMVLADAFAGLAFLDRHPRVDASRVALIGFSYGGIATLLAAHAQVAEALASAGRRFAAHIAFYGPCIAQFDDGRGTGAPVLMLYGTGDAIVDPDRCAEIERSLEAGGSPVTRVAFDGAYHQWDGRFPGPRSIGRNLAPCRFRVGTDGRVHDGRTGLPMAGPFTRKLILWLCSDSDGYLIGRDDAIRAQSNRVVADFLNPVFRQLR